MNTNGDIVSTEEQVLQRHRNEKKELNAKITQLRHSTKNDKKKKKEVLAEIDRLENDLALRHGNELRLFSNKADSDQCLHHLTNGINDMIIESKDNEMNSEIPVVNAIKYNEYKISKAQRRRDAKAVKEKLKQERIESEEQNAETSARDIERIKMNSILEMRRLMVIDIPSDGDCMYKAIEHQLSLKQVNTNVEELRTKTADYMQRNRQEFIPFLTSDKTGVSMTDEEYDDYCNEVAVSKSWGGQLELRVLSHVFQTPIEVIQAEGQSVVIGNAEYHSKEPLLLSYHRHAYQLGEHYNSLIQVNSN